MNEYTYLPDSGYKNIGITAPVATSTITISNTNNKEVVRIDRDGRIFWLGREVTTDDEFRQTMLELHKAFTTR
jgi:CYTH domain-containing protein